MTAVRFLVMEVHCRWCGTKIEVEIPESITTADEQLAECERQAEQKHKCQPEVA